MQRRRFFAVAVALIWCLVGAGARAEKPLDLGRTKFKDIAKYLDLTREQQAKVKPDVERIQDIVKQAAKQRGTPGFGAGGRTPVGGSRWGGGLGGNTGGVQVGERAERQQQRVEWQKEINNRIEEIESYLTPGQIEKFKAIQVPNILSSAIGG